MQRIVAGLVSVLAFLLSASPRSFAADDSTPAVLALALDTSGSVGEAELGRTRELTLDILKSLPAGSEVAVFTFDDQARVVQPRTSVADEVRKALTGVHIAGRYTALYDALYDASRYLRDAPPGRKAIVLVTDGKDENSSLNLDDGLRLAEENGIPVYAVGVGRVEERVLRRIAKLTGGDYLPETQATGSAIAAKVLAQTPPAPVPSPTPTLAPPPTTPAVIAETPPSKGAPSPRRLLWGRVLVGLLVLTGLILILEAVRRSRRPAARCPTCGRALATPFSECPFCAAEVAPREPEEVAEPDQAETIVGRVAEDDEHLEKTVTLQEKPVLVITSGPGTGHVFTLSAESMTSIGRAKANDIILDDVAVSSQHCRIRPDDGQFIVHDLRSTNGTFVNEHRVTRSHLRSGDVLKVGETTMQFRMDQKRP